MKLYLTLFVALLLSTPSWATNDSTEITNGRFIRRTQHVHVDYANCKTVYSNYINVNPGSPVGVAQNTMSNCPRNYIAVSSGFTVVLSDTRKTIAGSGGRTMFNGFNLRSITKCCPAKVDYPKI